MNPGQSSESAPVVDPRRDQSQEDLGGVSLHKERAAERVALAVVVVFAGGLVLAFLSPLLSYWLIVRSVVTTSSPASDQVTAVLAQLTTATLENVRGLASTFSSLLTLVLSYYFFKGSNSE